MTPIRLVKVNSTTPTGTRIALVEDSGCVTITETRSEPWRLAHGVLVVSVVGRPGGYSADRCHVLPREVG